MTNIHLTGNEANELLNFLEQEQHKGQYPEIESQENHLKDPEEDKLGDGLVELVLGGTLTLLGKLIFDYYTRNRKNEMTFELVKDKDRKMTITMKNLTPEEVRSLMREFLDSE